MALKAEPIDISGMPALVELAEGVRDTHEARVLRRGEEPLARLVPLHASRTPRKRRKRTPADYEAFLAFAGGWADVDVDAFLDANRASRDRSMGAVVDL